jgi:hypothetical protein
VASIAAIQRPKNGAIEVRFIRYLVNARSIMRWLL